MTSLIKVYNPFVEPLVDVIGESKKVWIAWLKSLFSRRPVGHHRWVSNPTETEIVIMDQGPYNSERYNARPAIITIVGPGTWSQGGLTSKAVMAPFPESGPTMFLGLSTVSLSINCLAREGEEARRIAYYIYRLIPVFENVLQKFGIHGVVSNLTIGQESPSEALVQGSSAPEWKMVPVQAPYMAKDALVLQDSSGASTFQPMAREIRMQMVSLLES